MSSSRDAPNPLRPYYVPPSIGIPPEQPANTSVPRPTGSRPSIGKSAKDFLSDFDYGGPLLDREGPSVGEVAKKLVDQALWKYTSVLLAQPFDVAKTILQVRHAAASEAEAETNAVNKRRDPLEVESSYEDVRMGGPGRSEVKLRWLHSSTTSRRRSPQKTSHPTLLRRNHREAHRVTRMDPRDGGITRADRGIVHQTVRTRSHLYQHPRTVHTSST